MNKIILYGAGKRCKNLCKILVSLKAKIPVIIDRNSDKWGKEIEGYKIESPEKLRELQGINWCITVADINEAQIVRKEMQNIYNYEPEKEVHYNKLIIEIYRENLEIQQRIWKRNITESIKKNIIFACGNGLGLGGVESWVIDICQILVKNDKQNIYILSRKGSHDIPDILERSIIYVDFDYKNKFSKRTILDLIEVILKKMPCKIITTNTDEIMLAAYLVKHYYPEMIDIIATIHNSNDVVYQNYMDFKECPDMFIGVSQDIRVNMLKTGIAPEKICTMCIPFPCEKQLVRTYTEDNLLPICIGYAGRMDGWEHSQKRMDLILKLIILLEKKKISFKVELAGDGPAREKMEQFIYSNNLNRKVKFLGRLKRIEIPAFWRRQDICINLADYEGRSISITEAMGNGAVPIVTATSGVNDDVIDGQNGFIVSLGDYCTMAEKIEYLSKHREQLYVMGKQAHASIYPKSSMESHINFWNKVFNNK